MLFCFFMCDDLSFINTTLNAFNPFEKNISMPRMNEKKFHTWEFQLKYSSRNMGCKLLQKRFTGKTTECSKHLRHIAIEKNILSELKMNFSNTSKVFYVSYSKDTLYVGIMQF